MHKNTRPRWQEGGLMSLARVGGGTAGVQGWPP